MIRVARNIPRWWQGFLKILAAYISIVGIVGFSLFMLEESIQTVMFSTWQSEKTGDWAAIQDATDLMDHMTDLLHTFTTVGGWLNPFMFHAYRSYELASRAYIDALNARILAEKPELFEHRVVTFYFTPDGVTETANGLELSNGRMIVQISRWKSSHQRIYRYAKTGNLTTPIKITGKIICQNNKIIIQIS